MLVLLEMNGPSEFFMGAFSYGNDCSYWDIVSVGTRYVEFTRKI
jgi:hypothetical protein